MGYCKYNYSSNIPTVDLSYGNKAIICLDMVCYVLLYFLWPKTRGQSVLRISLPGVVERGIG